MEKTWSVYGSWKFGNVSELQVKAFWPSCIRMLHTKLSFLKRRHLLFAGMSTWKKMASVNQYTTKLFSYFACWLKICWLLKWVHYLLFSPGTNHCFVPENWGARYPWVPILGFCKIKQHFLKSPGHFCLSLLCNYKNNQNFFFACILWAWLHKLYKFINSTVCLRKNIFKRLWWS